MRGYCIYAAICSLGVKLEDHVRQTELLGSATIMCKTFSVAHIHRRIHCTMKMNNMQAMPEEAYRNLEKLHALHNNPTTSQPQSSHTAVKSKRKLDSCADEQSDSQAEPESQAESESQDDFYMRCSGDAMS